jgi:hypothetical protein
MRCWGKVFVASAPGTYNKGALLVSRVTYLSAISYAYRNERGGIVRPSAVCYDENLALTKDVAGCAAGRA